MIVGKARLRLTLSLALSLSLAPALAPALALPLTAQEEGGAPKTEAPKDETPGGPGAEIPAEAAGGPLNLDAAVALALRQNPLLKAAEERRREVAAGVEEVRADAWLQASLVGDWSQSRNPSLLNSADFEDIVETFPGGAFEPRRQDLHRLGVELTQPLFTWGKVGAAVDLAEVVVDATEAQIEAVRLNTALAAAEQFFAVLSARRRLTTLEAQERLRRETLAVVEARFELGDATRLELLRGKAALAEVAPRAEEVRGEVAVAESRLRRRLGAGGGEGGLELRDMTGELAAAPPLEALLDEAFGRAEFLDLRLQRRVLELRQKVTEADGKPQLEMNGFYGRTARRAEDLGDPRFREWSLAVNLSWSFFDSGRRKGQVARLESQWTQLRWQEEDLRARVRLEIEAALAGYRSSLARWRAAEVSAEAAREASRVALEGYREGVALQTDWLEAQEQETEAEVLWVEARYDCLTELARLQRAVGRRPAVEWSPPKAGETGGGEG